MFRFFPIAVVVVAVLSSGAVSGVLTRRWAPTADLDLAAQRAQLPSEAGDWMSRETAVTPAEITSAQAASISRRVYTDRRFGNTVAAILVCGRAGPVSVHTPEVCYPNSGFEAVGQPARIPINGENSARFWLSRFRKPGVGQGFVTVAYGWNAGGKWASPDDPRLTYAGLPILFKLYVVFESPNDQSLDNENPSLDLLRALLPQLSHSLAPVAGSGDASK